MSVERGRWVEACRQWSLRHPLFVASLWVVVAYLALQIFAALLVIVLLALIAHVVLIGRPWMGVLCVTGVLVALGIGAWRDAADSTNAALLGKSAGGQVEAVALADARGDESFWQAAALLDGKGPKVWWQGHGAMPVEGSRISADGRFQFPQAPRNPGEFDRERWLTQQGVVAIFRQQPHSQGRVETGKWPRLLSSARHAMREAIGLGLEADADGAKVIRAVVLGEKPRGDDELLDDFRNSGSMHVFSVSGLHVGMVAVLVWTVAACTGLSRRWLALPVIIVVFAYAWLTGANAPAVRAAWMAAVFVGAFCFRRRPDLPNALGAVLLVLLLWDVRQLQQPSVQLSYGVVCAIAFGLPWTTRWYARLGAAPMYMPVAEIKGLRLWAWRGRQWVATTLAVSSAAAIGAAPLTLWHFGLVTPVSVIAALLMLPLVFVLMALAMISVLLSPMQGVTGPLMVGVNRANGLLASGCAGIAAVMSDLPGGHWSSGKEEGPKLIVFDLRHGDSAACLLPGKNAAALLLDCGGRGSSIHPLKSSLNRLGIEPDSVVLTHPDGGHVGGGHPLWRELPIRQALMPVAKARSQAYRTWLEQAPADGVRLLQASSMQGLPLGAKARLEWLHLPDPDHQDQAADHRVLVMRLHWQGWKILWHSDAGSVVERAMLESGRDLRADVIVAGSHSSDLSLGDAFIEAVAPRVIIIGNDDRSEGRRMDDQRIRHWRESGIEVFEQSECGAVILTPEEEGLTIEGFLDGRKLRLK